MSEQRPDPHLLLDRLRRAEAGARQCLEGLVPPAEDDAPGARPGWRSYAWSAALCAGVTLLTAPLHDWLDLSSIIMMFLLAVVFVAVRFGSRPAVMAAFLSVGAFDFFYVQPRFTFSVGDAQYLLTMAVMLVVALVIGQLTAMLRLQARVARLREARVGALYAMSRDLSGALLAVQIAEVAERFLRSEFGAGGALLVADLHDRLSGPAPGSPSVGGFDLAVAQWAFDHGQAAGHGTGTLPAAPVLYLPLKAPMRTRGVLAVAPGAPARLAGPEAARLLETCASLLAISLERIHYVNVAQATTVEMASERLRNSLLAAISHDLRTPLSALVGMAESMALTAPAGTREAQLTQSMREVSLRMSSQVGNLLDMARLQSGHVTLKRQWLPLEEAVGSAIRAMQGTLDPQRVCVSLPATLPLLHVDAALFERVLCNLLENATKYAPAHSPIEIGASVLDAGVRVVVDDRGPGLPTHKADAIFQMFERGRQEGATPGVGLGLAICRAIVEAHGGTITGGAAPGGGARFTIALPPAKPPPMAGEPDEPAEQGTT